MFGIDVVIWEVLLGLVPAVPAFFVTRVVLLKRKPVVYKVTPSVLTPIIAQYEQRQMEIEGKVASPVLALTKDNSHSTENAPSLLEQNYAKWANNKAQLPLIVESIKVLQTLSAMSALKLTTEERHNLEVLSNQTDELLSNFFNTPETIRTMPAVAQALRDQLTQIEEGASNVQVKGAETFIRNISVGTEFIKTKFNSEEL